MVQKDLFVARQPVFDAGQRIWGYELLYRSSSEAETAQLADAEESTLKVASTLLLSPDNGFRAAHCIVNCSPGFLLQGYAQGLLSERLVCSVSQDLLRNREVLAALDALAEKGATLAVTLDLHDAPPTEALTRFHVLELPVQQLCEAAARSLVQRRQEKQLLLASRIESHEHLQQALAAGADLCQGFHFQRPRTYSVRPLSTSLINRLKILQILDSPEENAAALTEAVEADAGISVRLLQFINSAMFSFVRRIESVRQSIALMGWWQLRSWLRLLVVTDMPATDKTRELACSSAVRAKFLELLALYSGNSQIADQLYMVGLFSLLEPMLDKPYSEIFATLQLQNDVHDALTSKGGPLLPWLELARMLESGNWLHLDAKAMSLGLSMRDISKSKLEAMAWANEFFSALG